MPDDARTNAAEEPQDEVVTEDAAARPGLLSSEDWWAVWLGGVVLLLALAATIASAPADQAERIADFEQRSERLSRLESEAASVEGSQRAQLQERIRAEESELGKAAAALTHNPLKPWLSKPGGWGEDPRDAFFKGGQPIWPGLLGVFAISLVLFGIGLQAMGHSFARFVPAFAVVFFLAAMSFVMAEQEVVNHYNLEYALWALLVGLVISNTIRTPAFLKPAVQTEFYIKTGLVLLGAEVLFNRLLALGLPGIFLSWVVTPIVLISTYLFGQYVLRISSKSLNMVISADMSVCGVSAAIATAAACRAKKEELSLAIGISLTFTVLMMVVQPAIIKAAGISEVVGGAWLGATIDSTGAVAAAGGILGQTALEVAATVKMIQNILIGVIAFFVAMYWVARVEHSSTGARPGLIEIWHRFPKFVLGFVAASVVFSLIYSTGTGGESLTGAVIGGTSKTLRGWFFCLAFVSIGLETNFRELGEHLKGGKPLILYVCGQSFSLVLSLLMAWLMFEKVFPDAAAVLGN